MKNYYENASTEDLMESEHEFNILLGKIRSEKEKGTSPRNKKVRELARKWSKIVYSFTKDKHDIQEQAERFHNDNPGNTLQFGVDGDIYRYIKEALK